MADYSVPSSSNTYNNSPKAVGSRASKLERSLSLADRVTLFDHCDCIVFDFDSTIIEGESLEMMLDSVLSDLPADKKQDLMAQIDDLTKRGMAGEMSFQESLEERLKIAKPTKKHVQEFVEKYCPSAISEGLPELIEKLQTAGKKIFILSGGFTDCIVPFATYLKIPKENVYAVEINWDDTTGEFLGLNNENKFSESKTAGAKAIRRDSFVNAKYTIAIGDGFSDYKLYDEGIAQEFFAYVEHAERDKVVALAPKVAANIKNLSEEFMKSIRLSKIS